jgi:hypothetical protein
MNEIKDAIKFIGPSVAMVGLLVALALVAINFVNSTLVSAGAQVADAGPDAGPSAVSAAASQPYDDEFHFDYIMITASVQ